MPGQVCAITAISLPGQKLLGKVQSINPVTDNQGTTVGVRILCANLGYILKEGMPVVATIVTAVHTHALTVPITAIVDDPADPQNKKVYVYQKGKVNRVDVKPGIEVNAHVEILHGLSAGEMIVASGAYGIPDGTAVEAQDESIHADFNVTSKGN